MISIGWQTHIVIHYAKDKLTKRRTILLPNKENIFSKCNSDMCGCSVNFETMNITICTLAWESSFHDFTKLCFTGNTTIYFSLHWYGSMTHFLELAWYLTIICNLSPRISNTVFWPQGYQAFTW